MLTSMLLLVIMEVVNMVVDLIKNLHLIIVKNGKKKVVSVVHVSPLQLEKKLFGKAVFQLFQIILVALKAIVKMEKAQWFGRIKIHMKANGKMVKHMDKEKWF